MKEPKARIVLCISGITGRMGQLAYQVAKKDPAIQAITGIDQLHKDLGEEIIFSYVNGPWSEAMSVADVILFFNNDPDGTVAQAKEAANSQKAIVVATTGLNHNHLYALEDLAARSPVMVASNFSLGINLLEYLLRQVAATLPEEFQPEIIDRHHANKLDAPSGTANTLAKVICEARNLNPNNRIQCGRSGRSQEPRLNNLVGIQTVRAGTIAGTHEVIFAGPSEVLELKHQAESPEIFARGALLACKWIVNQPPGWYNFGKDVLRLGSL